jgi:hypothetical protein
MKIVDTICGYIEVENEQDLTIIRIKLTDEYSEPDDGLALDFQELSELYEVIKHRLEDWD